MLADTILPSQIPNPAELRNMVWFDTSRITASFTTCYQSAESLTVLCAASNVKQGFPALRFACNIQSCMLCFFPHTMCSLYAKLIILKRVDAGVLNVIIILTTL